MDFVKLFNTRRSDWCSCSKFLRFDEISDPEILEI